MQRIQVYNLNLQPRERSVNHPYCKYTHFEPRLLLTDLRMKSKLFQWIDREVAVLFQVAHFTNCDQMIICEYLKGTLLMAAKQEPASCNWQQSFSQVIPAEYSALFIEELQNFALSPFSLETFDLLTEYCQQL